MKLFYMILTLFPFLGLCAGTAYDTMGPVVKIEAESRFGTAFAISTGGGRTILVTNAHVVGDVKKVVVKAFFWNEKRTKIIAWYKIEGKVLSSHKDVDIAFVSVPSVFGIPIAWLSSPRELDILTPIIAVGCGLGEDAQIYRGVIIDQQWNSKNGKPSSQGLMQTDCFTQPGVSGGPLWEWRNDRWQVVGIMSSGFRGTNMTFAIPITRLHNIIEKVSVAARPSATRGIKRAP